MEDLPAELCDKVISKCSQKDQAALCRVSKDFGILATRQMYRTIDLESSSQIMKCCRSIALRRSNAMAVRIIRMNCGSWQYYRSFQVKLAAFYRNIMAALVACGPNLLRLEIGFYLDLTRCRFPLLRGFSIARDVPFTTAMFSFLQHHPTLQMLKLKSTTIEHRTTVPIYFPHLLHFSGTNRIIDALKFGSSIQDIYIRWDAGVSTTAIETALGALALSAVSVQSFRSAHTRLPPQFLDILTRIFPRITILVIGLHYSSPNMLNEVGPKISKLKELCIFKIDSYYRYEFGDESDSDSEIDDDNNIKSRENFARELEVLASWSKLIPSLRSCTLPSGIEWTRPISSLWIPCTLKSESAVKDWWVESVLSGKLGDQINDFARSVGWELDAQGTLDSNQRNAIGNFPYHLGHLVYLHSTGLSI